MRVSEALVLSLVVLFLVPKPTESSIWAAIGNAVLGKFVNEIWDSFKDPDPLKITDNFIALNQKLENTEKNVSFILYLLRCYYCDEFYFRYILVSKWAKNHCGQNASTLCGS